MTEQDNEKTKNSEKATVGPDLLDPGLKYLSGALKSAFVVLQIIMVVLVALFAMSGFETIRPDEQALVLRFGRIKGIGEDRVLGPGLVWVFPYPIEQIIRIPVEKKIGLRLENFWYFEPLKDKLPEELRSQVRVQPTLDPLRDGYCIVRNEMRRSNAGGAGGSDYNIVHCKWQLIYKIDDPERFYTNIYVREVAPGQSFAEVMERSVRALLKNLTADAVVTAMVGYTIDQALASYGKIPEHVKKLMQEKLDAIEAGIRVVSVQLTDVTWPRQAADAFAASVKASQLSQRIAEEAQTEAEKMLNETAGPVAEQLLAALTDENTIEDQKEQLWADLAGDAQGRIDQARAYRTSVVEAAKANADYLRSLLPEYRKRPRLVVQKIYQDAIEQVLNSADEKIIIQPTQSTKGKEIRILLNRDPMLKRGSQASGEQ